MSKRLLIINCSARKSDEALCPAIERYQSPIYFVLRRFLRLHPDQAPVIWILSGKYGLIEADKKIIHYNKVMTENRGKELKGQIFRQFGELMNKHFPRSKPNEVFCHLSANYQLAFKHQLNRLEKISTVIISEGRPGEKSKLLKEWLESK